MDHSLETRLRDGWRFGGDPTGTSRRSFLSGAATAAAAGIAFGSFLPRAMAVSPQLYLRDIPGTGDTKVLNLALALEDVEVNLYQQAYLRLTTGGTNDLGVRYAGLGLATTEPDVAIVASFKTVEESHRAFLEGQLMSAKIPRLKYDFNIQALSRGQVLRLLYVFETNGAQAYLGSVPYFATYKYVQTATALQGIEARHSAVLATLRNDLFGNSFATAPVYTENNGIEIRKLPIDALAAASPYIVSTAGLTISG